MRKISNEFSQRGLTIFFWLEGEGGGVGGGFRGGDFLE